LLAPSEAANSELKSRLALGCGRLISILLRFDRAGKQLADARPPGSLVADEASEFFSRSAIRNLAGGCGHAVDEGHQVTEIFFKTILHVFFSSLLIRIQKFITKLFRGLFV
jgi:hypothetical protein